MSDEQGKAPDPWEKLPEESQDAWLAFRTYRDTPPDLRNVTRTGMHATATLAKWSKQHRWYERVAAYDATFDKLRVEERQKIFARRAQENAIDHMIMLSDAKDFVAQELRKWVEKSRENDMPATTRIADVTKLLDTAIKLDRLVRGETTENIGSKDLDLEKLDADELEKLEALVAKASKDEAN